MSYFFQSVDRPPPASTPIMDKLLSNDSKAFVVTTEEEKYIRATFLIVFVCLGFVTNTVLALIALQTKNPRFRRVRYYIISLTVICVIDSIANISLTLSGSINEDWEFSNFLCRFHAFCISFTSINISFGLVFFVIERYVSRHYMWPLFSHLRSPTNNLPCNNISS